MNKHALFIPFMSLLATSCGGGHITTTPVIKNAPSASLSTPTKKNLTTPTGMQDDLPFDFVITNAMTDGYYLLDGTPSEGGGDFASFRLSTSGDYTYISLYYGNYARLATNDYLSIESTSNLTYAPYTYAPFGAYGINNRPAEIKGVFHFKPRTYAYQEGFTSGSEEGFETGYIYGYQEGEAYNNPIIQNGKYAGLTAFPRRHLLEILARDVVSGLEVLQDGHFDLIDTNGNYTIYIKWSYSYPKTTFQDYGNAVIGELDWSKIISGNWSTSWFGKYDPELHQILPSPKYYATDAPIAMSFYPEVYLGSTIVGDVDYYFMGTDNDYSLGFADGQAYTIEASETYNNVFTIFTPAFRAVANFFNLNIGPFKLWYFFAIPLIVSLLILVLRLVKH